MFGCGRAGGVGWCFPHALLPLSRIFALILLLSADLHKSDSKPIQKKKERKKKKHLFYNDVTCLLKPAGKEPVEKSSLTGDLLPLSEAASFLWVCNGNKEPVFKRWLKFKALRNTTYCHVRLLENHRFFTLSSSSLFARSAQKIHKHCN